VLWHSIQSHQICKRKTSRKFLKLACRQRNKHNMHATRALFIFLSRENFGEGREGRKRVKRPSRDLASGRRLWSQGRKG